ncbi:MAG: cupin domain-containing protein [Microcoleus anatoxicus]|uniref:cupin domain-containing protein n=1 Tax=Microcoleus anatoxicus TaxID=2705319 RepID=UPI003670621B
MKAHNYLSPIDTAFVYGGNVERVLLFASSTRRNQHIVRLAYATIHPNCAGQRHFHPLTEERYYILEGNAKLSIGDQELSLKPGMCTVIPYKTEHCLSCVGDQPVKYIAFHIADGSFFEDVEHISVEAAN